MTAPARRARVLVVDDSVVVRRLVTDALGADPAIEVGGTAPNGRIALAKIPQLAPDLVTLDIEMPELDGLATLKELRRLYPRLPVIMFSTLTERGASATLDALLLGANECVAKPANVGSVAASIERVRAELVPKVKALCGIVERPVPSLAVGLGARRPAAGRPSGPAGRVDAVVIGVSTGGPNALAEVVPALPSDLPVPVLIVQHMPPIFTRHLAERLDARSRLTVAEAAGGEAVKPGTVWLAPGGRHLEVRRMGERVILATTEAPPENSCRPAVDVLFRTAVQVWGGNVLAVVMTGMGHDGRRGGEQVRAAGGSVIVQDEATSVVWGMPGSVVAAGLADGVLPLSAVAEAISRRVAAGRPSRHAAVAR